MSKKTSNTIVNERGEEEETKLSERVARKWSKRVAERDLDPVLAKFLIQGRLYASLSSRPGQSGRADGYILEGRELEFYAKQLARKKK